MPIAFRELRWKYTPPDPKETLRDLVNEVVPTFFTTENHFTQSSSALNLFQAS